MSQPPAELPKALRKRLDAVSRCFDETGALTRWPARRADQILVLWVLWSRLPSDTRFSEQEVNSMLRDWNRFEDFALLRRELVDLDLLRRTPDGRIYRRVENDPPEDALMLFDRLEQALSQL